MSRPARRAGRRPRTGPDATTVVVLAVVLLAVVVAACGSDPAPGTPAASGAPTSAVGAVAGVPARPVPGDCTTVEPERLVPQVVAEHPHDPTAFTQGLLVADGQLLEGTGLVGRSTVRRVDLPTGSVLASAGVPADEFGEGLARAADGRLVQLTWRDGVAFVRDPDTLEVVDRWTYVGEGWGLTTLDDGTFVQSDGSDRLTRRDGSDFEPLDQLTVTRADGPADRLNELEWDGARLWANRWQADEILRIDPRCGQVDGVVDASALTADVRARAVPDGLQPPEVLNGVALLPGTDRFLVTGKLWPVLYEVRFVPATASPSE